MAKKSPTQRIERLEDIAIGAGFLLQKLQYMYGADFGYGMNQQVSACISDCNQVAASRAQREATAKAAGEAS